MPAIVLVCATLGLSLPQSDSLLTIERTIAQAERRELREDGTRLLMPPDREWLVRARRQVEASLRSKPDDAWSLVLLARLGRFVLNQARGAECTPEHGCVLDTTYDDKPFHAALDRALSIQPNDAATHFWKARLIDDGRPILRNSEFELEVDTTQLLMHAQRALALETKNLRYREFLAMTLADMGRYREAEDIIREAGKTHPLYLIFRDFTDVPIPDGAVPWPGHAVLAAVGMRENAPRFAAQSGRSWAVTSSIDELEAFYRRRWSGFRFFPLTEPEGAEGDSARGWLQNFQVDRNGRLQPARDSGFIARLQQTDTFDGLIMAVRQVRRHDEGAPEIYPAAMAGKDFLEIVIVTSRKGH